VLIIKINQLICTYITDSM